MTRYVARRLVSLVPVLVTIGVVTFVIIHLIPGNPADVILGNQATAAQVAQLTHQLGLDRPLWDQFVTWSANALQGNLGQSIFYQQPVLPVVLSHLVPTATLAAMSTAVSIAIALPAGLLAASQRGRVLDRALMAVSLLGVSVPGFWLAFMLILVFAVLLGWLPVAGYVPLSGGVGPWLSHLVLPVAVLAAGQSAIIARMLRDGTLESLRQPYIRTARAKGATERSVLLGHALPNAAIPTLTIVGNSLASLLSGVVVVEVVFGIPGIGNLIIQAMENRDYPLIEGVTLIVALGYVAVNLVVDLLYALADPRVRLG
ncbi:MAG: ABC transporter permease [Actinomycetota bacterium]|nr:ABC transporter permease [Actinomycetota bacterium]